LGGGAVDVSVLGELGSEGVVHIDELGRYPAFLCQWVSRGPQKVALYSRRKGFGEFWVAVLGSHEAK